MNKSLKVISSVALAGMLALNAHSPKALAETSRFVGTYNGMAQIVLTDATEQATLRDISSKFNITSWTDGPLNDNAPLKTGQKFTTSDGKDYTVVVYGDVNGDGMVTSADASDVLKYYAETQDLDELQLEAANVDRTNMEVNSADASNILKFYAETIPTVVSGNLPHDEENPVEEDIKYTLEINGGKTVNNTATLNAINVTATPGATLKDEDGNTITLKIRAVGISNVDDATKGKELIVPGVIGTFNDNTVKSNDSTIDLTKFKNGTVTVQLYYEKANKTNTPTVVVVGNQTVKLNVNNDLKATNITINRDSTVTAKLSIDGEKLSKFHYITSANDLTGYTAEYNTDTTKDFEVKFVKTSQTDVETKVANNVKNITISDLLDQAYDVYYALEDEDGNLSAVKKVTLPKFGSEAYTKVAIVKADTITANTNQFTWTNDINNTAVTAASFTVNILKDGKIIRTVENQNTTAIDITNDITTNGTGTYTITVKANATASKSESQVAESAGIVVGKLNNVTVNPLTKIDDNTDGTYTISWNAAESQVALIDHYEVRLYSVNNDGEESLVASSVAAENSAASVSSITINSTDKTADVTLSANTIYYATVTAVSKNELINSNSEAAKSENAYFLEIDENKITGGTKTSKTVTLDVTDPINLYGKTTKYKFEFYKKNEATENYEKDGNAKDIEFVETTEEDGEKTYSLVIKNLDPNTTYYGKLIVEVDNVTDKSGVSGHEDRTTGENGDFMIFTTYATFPNFAKGLTISKVSQEANETTKAYETRMKNSSNGKIVIDTASSSKKVAIDGELFNDYTAANFENTTNGQLTVFNNNVNLAKALEDGDQLKIDGDNVEITFVRAEGNTNISTVAADKNVTLKGNTDIKRNITADSKTLTLDGGNNSIYDISNVTATKIIVKNGMNIVTATDSQKVTLVSGATATINGVSIKASEKDTEITIVDADQKTFSIPAATKAVINGNTVKSEVSTISVAVNLTTKVDTYTVTNKDTVVINNATIKTNADSQTFTVNDKKVITSLAFTAGKAITEIGLVDLDIKSYSVATLKNVNPKYLTIPDGKDITVTDKTNQKYVAIDEVVEYIALYNALNDTGATIQVAKDAKAVTLKSIPTTATITLDLNAIK